MTNEEIIKVVKNAMAEAESKNENWADLVDIRLAEIGVEVDENASREDVSGYGPIAILMDGRKIWQAEDTGIISIDSENEIVIDDSPPPGYEEDGGDTRLNRLGRFE